MLLSFVAVVRGGLILASIVGSFLRGAERLLEELGQAFGLPLGGLLNKVFSYRFRGAIEGFEA